MQNKILSQRFAAALFVAFAAAVAPAHADIVYSNFGTGGGGPYNSGQAYIISSSRAIAQSFQPGADYQFTSAELALQSFGGDTATVYLHSDAGGTPGLVLDTLVQQSLIPGSGSIVSFNCATCPVLSTGTTYWVVATMNLGQYGWFFNNTGASGALYNFNGSSNSGPWAPPLALSSAAYQINGTALSAVPEPASIVVLAPLLAGAALWRLRRFAVRLR